MNLTKLFDAGSLIISLKIPRSRGQSLIHEKGHFTLKTCSTGTISRNNAPF